MDPEPPITDGTLPGEPAPALVETAEDRHRREMEVSFERLEETVEHGFVRVVKMAVPALIGLILAAVGVYVLGASLRDRAERRRLARQMKIVSAERVVRAERILGRRAGFRARHRAPALIDGPLSVDEAGKIISGVLAELDTPA
jgi:hypothetical protein